MFQSLKVRRSIHRTLKAVSRQRVALILEGNVWVIERCLPEDDVTQANIRTCHLRGWVEPVVHAIPKGSLTEDGRLPDGYPFTSSGPIYRLTDSGWHAIYRSHVLGLLSLIATIVSVGVALVAFLG